MKRIVNNKLDNEEKERLIAKYSDLLKTSKGTFTMKTKGRLLGIPMPGRERPLETIPDFWYDQRNKIKTALKDLEFFIEVAEKTQVNQVITRKTLEPIVRTLLWDTALNDPDPNRADIARLFITWGFEYLRSILGSKINLINQRAIEEAIDLSNYLAESFKSEDNRRYLSPGRAYPVG